MLRRGVARLIGGIGALGGLASLGGCGGGEAAPGDARRHPLGGVDSGGTGAPMMAFFSAEIAAVAPLVVAGVQFELSGSLLLDADGRALQPGELRPGMAAQVAASAIDRTSSPPRAFARSVQVGDAVRGPLQRIDAAAGALDVLGQRVVLTATTQWDASLAGAAAALRPGAPLQVWGQLDAAGGRIVATRIAAAAPGALAVRGVLARIDRNASRVTIGALDATAPPGFVWPAGLEPGDVVRATLHADGATLLSLRGDALQLPDGVEAELHGRVTRVDSALRFAVDGVEVDAGAAPAVGIAVGALAEVHGHTAAGVLVAGSVAIEPDEPVQLEGRIASVDAAARTFVLRGVSVAWDGATRFEGGPPRLLAAQRKVAVLGRWNAQRTQLRALRIHVEA